MTLRTRLWGQVGITAKDSATDGFKELPALDPPEKVGLRTSEQAWGVPDAGILIADDLPPSVLPLSSRAMGAGVETLLSVLPNTEQHSRWDIDEASRELVEFMNGKHAPTMWPDWRTDAGWARTFVQGPCAGDLHQAGDVWMVDASVLALGERRPGVLPLGVKIALEIDEDGARPAWIDLEGGERVYPNSSNWPVARLTASAAMQNYVGHVRHVLNLHYVAAQGTAVLVHNCLPWHHPVTRLLFPHAAGSLSVNWTANHSFMGENRIGAQTYAYTWKGLQQLVPIALRAFNWADYNMPEVFERRGTMALIERKLYPYGEDALLIWQTIEAYVGDYLAQYYESDAAVSNDFVLQTAFEELDPAVAKPLRARTLAELRLVVTRLIHMVSVEHKLVSGIAYDYFTQPYYFPTLVRHGKTVEEAVPFREEAENNVMFRYAISSHAWPLLADWSYVALDGNGAAAMRRFRQGLLQAGEEIDARNRRRRVPFPHLHPRELETSVAV